MKLIAIPLAAILLCGAACHDDDRDDYRDRGAPPAGTGHPDDGMKSPDRPRAASDAPSPPVAENGPTKPAGAYPGAAPGAPGTTTTTPDPQTGTKSPTARAAGDPPTRNPLPSEGNSANRGVSKPPSAAGPASMQTPETTRTAPDPQTGTKAPLPRNDVTEAPPARSAPAPLPPPAADAPPVTGPPVTNGQGTRSVGGDGGPVPTDQSETPSDRGITQQIRQNLVDRQDLSMDAKNIKIITVNGVVTLRGQVADANERNIIVGIAQSTGGVARVDNQLETAH